MCGIAGWFEYGKTMADQKNILDEMSKSIKHRGPDAHGEYIEGGAALLHRRLSIIDPEHGKQPMIGTKGNKKYVLIYNGELYNTSDIRKELLNLGYHFNTHSDTEVLLNSYLEWEEDCVLKLNGIYAFAVYDASAESVFLARDRMGVKPLFYHVYDGGLVFGSEIKALLSNPHVSRTVEQNGLSDLFFIGPGRTPGETPFKDIKELKPGQMALFNHTGIHISTYWKLEAKPHTDSKEQTLEKLQYLMKDSICRQLISDVPIATFLSGGLDSSAISAIAAKEFADKNKGPLTTYSVDYTDNSKYFKANAFQPNSDGYYIEIMQKAIGSKHQNIVLDNMEVADALEKAVIARDLPGMADIDSSLLLFCENVKQNHTVVLSGECADEIFGGYPWYLNEEVRDREDFPWSGNTKLKSSLLRPGLLSLDPIEYVLNRYKDTVKATPVLDGESRLDTRIREISMLNFGWFMQTLLDRKDRMSMYNGLEVRVPFCDHRIVEYAFNIPWELKSLGREKGLLRKAFEDILPNEIIYRKKSPYPKTHNPIYMNQLKKQLSEIISNKNEPIHQIIDANQVKQLLQTDAAVFTVPWYGQLMTAPQIFAYLYQINYWLTTYKVDLKL